MGLILVEYLQHPDLEFLPGSHTRNTKHLLVVVCTQCTECSRQYMIGQYIQRGYLRQCIVVFHLVVLVVVPVQVVVEVQSHRRHLCSRRCSLRCTRCHLRKPEWSRSQRRRRRCRGSRLRCCRSRHN